MSSVRHSTLWIDKMDITNINTAINALSLRERIILTLIAMLVGYSAIDIFLTQTVIKEQVKQQKIIEDITKQIAISKTAIQAAQQKPVDNQSNIKQQQLLDLRKEINQIFTGIRQNTSRFIKQGDMYMALDYIINNPVIKITNLSKSDPIPLLNNSETLLSSYNQQQMEINFNANYLDTLKYIQYLEHSTLGLIIDKINYSQQKNGGHINIKLHLMSRSQAALSGHQE